MKPASRSGDFGGPQKFFQVVGDLLEGSRVTGDMHEAFWLTCNNQKPIILQHNCIPDEHYVQTLLSMSGLEHELEKRTLTYTSWNRSKNVKGKQTWHPITFEYVNGSPKQINAIKGINHVDYETEFRTEWCRCNSTFAPCYLFARKFSRGAAMRILTEGFVGTFNAPSLLAQNSL